MESTKVDACCSPSKETNTMESERPELSSSACGPDACAGAGAGASGSASEPEQRVGARRGAGRGQSRLSLPSKNAFVNFLAMLRPVLKESSPAEAVERATDRWTQMSEEERRPFFEMAVRVRRRVPHRCFLETEMAAGRRPWRLAGFRARGGRRRRQKKKKASKSKKRRRKR